MDSEDRKRCRPWRKLTTAAGWLERTGKPGDETAMDRSSDEIGAAGVQAAAACTTALSRQRPFAGNARQGGALYQAFHSQVSPNPVFAASLSGIQNRDGFLAGQQAYDRQVGGNYDPAQEVGWPATRSFRSEQNGADP